MRHVCRPNSDAILVSLVFLALAFMVLVLTRDFTALSLFHFSSSLWTLTTTTSSTSSISMHPPSFINDEEKKRKKMVVAYHDAMEQGLKDKLGMKRCEECDEKLKKLEASLAMDRALIKEATLNHNCRFLTPSVGSFDFVPYGDSYRNPCVFHRNVIDSQIISFSRSVEIMSYLLCCCCCKSYLLMEKLFKIFIYEEGEPPFSHYGSNKDIYSMEGVFLNLIEMNTEFKTSNPGEAHVYFLPFSVVMILQHLFDPVIRDKSVLERVIGDYVRIVSQKLMKD